MKKIRVGISIGDMNGIGVEVILKTLDHPNILNFCTPVIYGSSKIISYHKNIVGLEEFSFTNASSAERVKHDRINVVNCWQDNVNITLGKLSDTSGKYAKIALLQAVNDLKNNTIDALVTGPINKKAMQMADFPYPGHTEFLTKTFEVKESLMLMVNDNLRIGLVTNHLPVSQIASSISKQLILNKVRLMDKSLREDFGIEKPTIAVLGLNPHAGDEGAIGEEEETIIRPAIIELKKKGMMVMGPYPADGFFGSGMHHKVDGVLAMYHDQGLVPFKALSFGKGVNYTAGLPIVRTSPDHGTAYEIAGKNIADPSSFRAALFQAIDIARSRKNYKEMTSNPIVRKSQKSLNEEELAKEGALNKEDDQQ